MAISKNLIILFGIVLTLLLYISSHATVASREHYGERKEVIVGKGVTKDIVIARRYPKRSTNRPCNFANRCQRFGGFPMAPHRRKCNYDIDCNDRAGPPGSS